MLARWFAQYPYAHSPEHDHGYNDRNDNGEAVPLMMVRGEHAVAAATVCIVY